MKLNWNNWMGKNVHIILNNNYEYNCVIDSVDNRENGLVFIEITDKFGSKKVFSSGEIKFIEEKWEK